MDNIKISQHHPALPAETQNLVQHAVSRLKKPAERSKYQKLIDGLLAALLKIADHSELSVDEQKVAGEGFLSFISNATGRSLNTLRQLKHAFELYDFWCVTYKHPTLPADKYQIVNYLGWLDVEKQHAPSTISSHQSAVSLLHRIAGLVDTTKTQHVIESMAAIRMNAIRNGYNEEQQAGFRRHHLLDLKEVWRDSVKPIELRDLALLSIAWDSLLRESELARLTLSMLKKDRKTGNYSGHISYTKNTSKKKDAAGDIFFVSAESYELLIKAIAATGGNIADKQSLVFYPLTKAGKANKRFWNEDTGFSPLRGEAVDDIFDRAYSVLLPDDVEKPWRGHSARIGRAQDLSEAGATNQQIMQMGRWSDPKMPSRYTRQQELTEIAAMFT
ncbi:hypothetical protein RJ45_09470 [Photobacterium gaetbulicola]|uniref:Core-binding (CB) domain-containing protein n=1 Tax=Photobacterium gaetbulicola TaxID=1295392 RepID=A0A0B9H4U8_9GAMM|nr:tyrosine-type recombinase/integrase [Photobacterium gaetbulicola]KHT63917.1 hypothetical protein RJ45_09470 [Photobacterium gaetbulicola]